MLFFCPAWCSLVQEFLRLCSYSAILSVSMGISADVLGIARISKDFTGLGETSSVLLKFSLPRISCRLAGLLPGSAQETGKIKKQRKTYRKKIAPPKHKPLNPEAGSPNTRAWLA